MKNTQPPISRRLRQSTPSDPEILPELISEILSWLPVKSLMVMKCVRKSWNTLISDRDFVKMHLRRSEQNSCLWSLISTHDADYDEYHYNFVHFHINHLLRNRLITDLHDPYYRFEDKVVGSCNGLICFSGYSRTNKMWFRLWNPATRAMSDILGSNIISYHYIEHRGKFVFGYDESTDTYKMVAVGLNGSEVSFFSFGDKVWRTIQSFPMVTLKKLSNSRVYNGVYLSCCIIWFVYLPDLRNDDPYQEFVLTSLDLATETYIEMSPPREFFNEKVSREGGNICVLMASLCFYYDFNRTDFVLWKMTEFGDENSWIQFFKIRYNNSPINYRFNPDDMLINLTPLHLSKDGETVILFNNLQEYQAILYNRRTNKAKKTRINKRICWYKIMDYVESLVSTS